MSSAGIDTTHHVAAGYQAKPLLRWGDPLAPGLPPFNPNNQSAADQLKRFGYNNDYIAYFPIDGSSTHGLLCINHEYTNEELMFPGIKKRQDTSGFGDMTAEIVDIEMAAHGVTVVEIVREGADWEVVLDSPYNRRISPASTVMTVDGPAVGNERLQTSDDPSGKTIQGTLNNCAGGKTPVGHLSRRPKRTSTAISGPITASRAAPRPPASAATQAQSYERYGIPGLWQAWGKFIDRFNVDAEPNEPNRFGWIVEIDPFEPDSEPVKHTALGRFCHEGAECVVNTDGRVVVYCGDDGRGEYVYRFVSDGHYDPDDRAANMTPAVARPAVGGAVRRRRHGPLAAARVRPPVADAGLRIRVPGRRGDRRAPRRGSRWARPAWTGRRTCSPTRSPARSMSSSPTTRSARRRTSMRRTRVPTTPSAISSR